MSKTAAILYVDDEEIGHILFDAIFGDDFDVHKALSAGEALEILRGETIHLLITDQCMPDKTGAELLAEIRDEFPDIGRVMLTAYSDVDAIIQAVNVGRLDRYVTKPWDADELRDIIDMALEKVDQRRQRRCLIEGLGQAVEREQGLRETLRQYVPDAVLDKLLKTADEPPDSPAPPHS